MKLSLKIKDLEVTLKKIEAEIHPKQHVFMGYRRKDGSILYEIERGNNKEYIDKEEFNEYIESMKYEEVDRLFIFDVLPISEELKIEYDP